MTSRGRFEDAYRAVAVAPYDHRLWDDPDPPTTGLAPAPAGYPSPERWLVFARNRRLEELGLVITLGGSSRHPALHSSAPTPFVIDGMPCASLAAFFHALQLPDEDQRRTYARAPFEIRLRAAATFRYRGEVIVVGSIEHDTLIARAVEAKIRQHEVARRELVSTNRAPIYIGGHFMTRRFDQSPGGLWRAMPLALMLVRARL